MLPCRARLDDINGTHREVPPIVGYDSYADLWGEHLDVPFALGPLRLGDALFRVFEVVEYAVVAGEMAVVERVIAYHPTPPSRHHLVFKEKARLLWWRHIVSAAER